MQFQIYSEFRERQWKFVGNNAELANPDCCHEFKVTKVANLHSQIPATDTVYFNTRFHVSSYVRLYHTTVSSMRIRAD